MQIEGFGSDERIYGKYGPGSVSNTLSSLLDGSDYNYIIVGSGAGQKPAKLVLTVRSNAPILPNAHPASNTNPMASAGGASDEQPDAQQPDAMQEPDPAPPPDAMPDSSEPPPDSQAEPPDAQGDQANPNPSQLPQAKTPQQIFDELRQMHPN